MRRGGAHAGFLGRLDRLPRKGSRKQVRCATLSSSPETGNRRWITLLPVKRISEAPCTSYNWGGVGVPRRLRMANNTMKKTRWTKDKR